jgi:hypothetical protein
MENAGCVRLPGNAADYSPEIEKAGQGGDRMMVFAVFRQAERYVLRFMFVVMTTVQ